jgi:hypothetical protein
VGLLPWFLATRLSSPFEASILSIPQHAFTAIAYFGDLDGRRIAQESVGLKYLLRQDVWRADLG